MLHNGEEVEPKLLAILTRHGHWKLPMPLYWHTLPCCIASEDASATEGGFRRRPLRQQKVRVVEGDGRPATRICLAAVKQDRRIVDIGNPMQHCLRDYKPAMNSLSFNCIHLAMHLLLQQSIGGLAWGVPFNPHCIGYFHSSVRICITGHSDNPHDTPFLKTW